MDVAQQVNPVVTQDQLKWLEKQLDYLFSKAGMEVEFSKHFLDRVNDKRNTPAITVAELSSLFSRVYRKFSKQLASGHEGMQAVMKDHLTDINVPFVLKWNSRKKEMEIISKTVMRKHRFMTSNKVYTV